MKRRDFICGLSGLLAGFCIGNMVNIKADKQKIEYKNPRQRDISLGGFGIAISSHCNLNCKGCDVYSPLAKKEFVTYEQFCKDMEKLKELAPDREFDTVFIGGEPLLNPELVQIMYKTKELFPNAKRAILTNGTLLNKMGNNFWQAIKDTNVKFSITKYPINIDFKSDLNGVKISQIYQEVKTGQKRDLLALIEELFHMQEAIFIIVMYTHI